MFDEKLLLNEKLEYDINVLRSEIEELDRLDQMGDKEIPGTPYLFP